MKSETFIFKGAEGRELPAYVWLPEGEIKALLQISHGMTEHMGRYGEPAESLCARGIAAAGFDLRGHGKNPGSPGCASFGEGGWELSLEDMHLFYELLERRLGAVPHAMLGFSLGSFLLRDYLNKYSDRVWRAVIMGTGFQSAAVLGLLKKLVQGQINKFGADSSSAMVRKLSFGAYNSKFRPAESPADWLCGDAEQRKAYLEDPLCRKEISTGLFFQMLDSMQRTGGRGAFDNWDKTMPVLLISGAEDPVGDMGRGVKRLFDELRGAGIENVSMKLLEGGRHDILHEISCGARDEAVGAITEFLCSDLNSDASM